MDKIKYPFTRTGAQWFMHDVYNDDFSAMDNNEDIEHIVITVGNREINVPDLAQCFELLEDYLKEAVYVALEA